MNTITVRLAIRKDRHLWKEWLMDQNILPWFPMSYDEREIEDAVSIWESYIPKQSVFTVEVDKEQAGLACLYLQPFKKLAHQSIFAILVSPKFRGRGVGTTLLQTIIKEGKERLGLEQLHLEVYESNPAIHLYERFGFVKCGLQKHFTKENGQYLGKIFMYKFL